jgi:hypothetical protein
VFEELTAEIEALAARDLSVGSAGLGPEVLELGRLATALAAQHLRFLAAFEKAEGYADEQLTASAWLQTQTNLSAGQAHAEVRASRLLAKLPALAGVSYAGDVTPAHLQAVATGLRDLPEDLWPEVDADLAVVARVLTAKELAEWLRERRQVLEPERRPRDETQHAARRLSVTTGFDGMTDVHGRLTPEVGEKLLAALSAASRPDAEGEIRLRNQRTADALEMVLDEALAAGRLPEEGGEKPHINLSVDLDRIAEAGAAGSSPRFAWTGPTTKSTARRLTCDGVLLPIFTRGGGVLDVGRRTRVVSAALRAFVVARDKTCRWPGCTMPARWSEVHHVQHWADGGRTDRSNLVLMCQAHHKAAHDGRWMIQLDGPGQLRVRRRRRDPDPYYNIRADTAQPRAGAVAVRS